MAGPGPSTMHYRYLRCTVGGPGPRHKITPRPKRRNTSTKNVQYLDQKALTPRPNTPWTTLGPGPTCNLKYVCKDHMEHDKQKDQSGDIPENDCIHDQVCSTKYADKVRTKTSLPQKPLKYRPNRVTILLDFPNDSERSCVIGHHFDSTV